MRMGPGKGGCGATRMQQCRDQFYKAYSILRGLNSPSSTSRSTNGSAIACRMAGGGRAAPGILRLGSSVAFARPIGLLLRVLTSLMPAASCEEHGRRATVLRNLALAARGLY